MRIHIKWLYASFIVTMIGCTLQKDRFNPDAPTAQEPAAPVTQNPEPNAETKTEDASPASKPPMEARTPRDAQRDAKTFLALSEEEPMHGLKHGEEQMKVVCAKIASMPNIANNAVMQKFCVQNMRPKSIIELQTILGLQIVNPNLTRRGDNGSGGNPAFAVQGHSSSLVGRFVSAINPRVLLMSASAVGRADPNYVIMGFVRGEQFAEIIINSPTGPEFFLAGFKQACNSKPEGCNPGELLTPAIESGWTEFSLYHEDEIKNSIVDCRQCHQTNGPDTPKLLRMQELQNPWTHFFRDNTAGITLINDYYAAHGTDEVYGGIPGPMIRASDPANLEDTVRDNGSNVQPNEFDTDAIQSEVEDSSPNQPEDNTIPGRSATWDALFARVLTGEMIPVPYHDVKVTEPALLAKFTKQYQDFKAGLVPMDKFEDHRNVLRTDQKQLGDMGFAVAPEMTPQQTLMLACAQCHNSRLDQTLTRSRFNVDLASMQNAAAEIDIAISRIKLGYSPERLKSEGIKLISPMGQAVAMEKGEHLLTMPPRRFKQLTDTQIDELVKYLEEQKKALVK
jgi:5-methylcytosine-specific restriction endonuclease McrA